MRRVLPLVPVLLLLVAAAPAAAARSVPQGFFGANWDGSIAFAAPYGVQDVQYARMAAAGVESLRPAFSWDEAQSTPDGPLTFTRSDRIVEMASRHGISVLPIVIGVPPWERQEPKGTFSPPRSAYAYGRWLTALIARYGPSGSFWSEHPDVPKLPIRTWQIWNEPHLGFQWTVPRGTDWAAGYAHLLRVAYKAIKAADPGAKVVLAGLTNVSPTYLQQLYKRGIRGYFDIAAIHPYTRVPGGVVSLSQRFRAVMVQHGDARKQLWVTELGLPASKGRIHSGNFLQTTAGGMARFLGDSYSQLAAARRSLHIGRVYWYTWASDYRSEIFRFTGLLRYVGGDPGTTAQPAYSAYVGAARRYEGCAKSASGACR